MLPPFLKGTYAIYKEDTDFVASWLASNAKNCGYPLNLLSNVAGRLSRQETRKKTKKKKNVAQDNGPSPAHAKPITYTIAIKDFVPLAEHIVAFQKPPVRVPSTFVKVLDRAIALRKKHNSWFSDTSGSSKNNGHTFFLSTLERVRKILKSRMPSDTVDDPLTKILASTTTKSLDRSHVGNVFAGLSFEDPSDGCLRTASPGDAQSLPVEVDDESHFQAERLQKAEEQYLAAHCLLADISSIREHIKSLWSMYRDGQMDLHSASVTTNTAVELVRRMQEDYDANFPNHSDFEGLIHIFYTAQCVSNGQDPNHRQRPGDAINMAMYDLADHILLPAYTIMASLSDAVVPNGIPLYKPGHFGFRDLSTAWSQQSPHDKFQDDKLVLFEAFSDLSAVAKINCFAEDELIRGVRGMAPGKKVPLWLTFAVQNFLDIQHVMGSQASQAFFELQTAASHIDASLRQNAKFHEKLRIDTWSAHNDQVLGHIQNIIDTWIKQDNVKKIIERSLRGDPTIATQIDGEPFKLLKQYPSLCGIWLFSLRFLMQEAGVTLCNAWGSVLCTAHLYNASRQEKLLKSIWKDMELVLLLQDDDRMFIGDRPKEAEDYLKRFNLCMGFSVTSLARNTRQRTPRASPKGSRGLENSCELAKLFAKRYPYNGKSMSTNLDAVEKHIKAQFNDCENFAYEGKPPTDEVAAQITAKYNITTKLNTHTFLEGLANSLRSESMHLTFDFLRLHCFCWTLLRRIGDACSSSLHRIFGPDHSEQESELPFMVGDLLMCAFSADEVAKKQGVNNSSKVFSEAVEAMEAVLQTGAGGICARMMEQYYGFAVDWEDFERLQEDK